MKTVVLSRSEQMLFALLRASLNQREVESDFFRNASSGDWKECYSLSARQGVMALAWDGLMKLPADLMPPKALKLTWGLAVQDYERKYERYCKTVDELMNYYRGHGIAMVQLKGVGLSSYYPVPSHREGGDIDIYTYSIDKNRMTDAEANRLADELMRQQGIDVDMHSPKHSNFYYKGIPIENHKTFLNVEKYSIAGQADASLRTLLEPQPTKLMNGEYECLIPSVGFNLLFVAFHAAQHYGAGLAVHHLCDWAVLIDRYGVNLPDGLTDKRFRRAVAAFTCLCNRFLGTSVRVEEDVEDFADEMLEEILHPKFIIGSVPVKGKLNVLKYKLRRFRYIHRLNNQVLEWPMWKHIWESVVVHLRHPETIF